MRSLKYNFKILIILLVQVLYKTLYIKGVHARKNGSSIGGCLRRHVNNSTLYASCIPHRLK